MVMSPATSSLAAVPTLRNLQVAGPAYKPAGTQTGRDSVGSSFGASLIYNPSDNTVTIVGSSYGSFFADSGSDISNDDSSGCFVATASLPDDSQDVTSIDFTEVQVVTHPEVTESCNSILKHGNRIFASGYTEPGGVLELLRNRGSLVNTLQYGMILDMEFASDTDRSVNLLGGRVLQESAVVYPVALASSPSDDYIYVVSMETTDVSRSEQTQSLTQQDPTHFFSYGSGFQMTIERIKISKGVVYDKDKVQSTLAEDWRQSYATIDGESVHVTDIAKISNDILIVVGSTVGNGAAFAGPFTGDDMDGFVTKVRTDSGKIYRDWENPQDNPSTTRIQSVNGGDDWVLGICRNPRDQEHFYLVGATRGQLGSAVDGSTENPSTQAYLMKMELNSLEPVWITQLGADSKTNDTTVVHGGSCAVTSDGETVYFGGVIKADAALPLAGVEKSFGGDDIFVAKLDTKDGVVDWIRQMGTEENDEFARQGLSTDAAGNAIVLGNTVGSMYRKRGDKEDSMISDVFLMTISRYNGNYQVTGGRAMGINNGAPVPSPSSQNPSDSKSDKFIGLLMFLLASIVATAVAALYAGRRMPKEIGTDRSKVLGYLEDFDIEEVDLKHSATGGWHCNYTNTLAEGFNRGPGPVDGGLMALGKTKPDGTMFAPLTAPAAGNNILSDSLFMDEDEPVLLGGLDGSSGARRTSGYDGLIDAYNNTSIDSEQSSRRKQRDGPWGRDIV